TLGGTEYVVHMHRETIGSPPTLDLAAEARVQSAVRGLIASGSVRTAHDVSLGGLAIALAEMAIASAIGIRLDTIDVSSRRDTYWFGERSGSIVIACESERVN